jgi:hypothetical protein
VSVRQVYAARTAYVVTKRGHEDLVHAELCHCRPKFVGLLIECPDCGTVWGYAKDSALNSPQHHKKGE